MLGGQWNYLPDQFGDNGNVYRALFLLIAYLRA